MVMATAMVLAMVSGNPQTWSQSWPFAGMVMATYMVIQRVHGHGDGRQGLGALPARLFKPLGSSARDDAGAPCVAHYILAVNHEECIVRRGRHTLRSVHFGPLCKPAICVSLRGA